MSDATNQLSQVYQVISQNFHIILKSDIKRLNTFLGQEISEREDGDSKISNYLNSDLKKIDESLSELKGYGENSEKKIFETIKSSVAEIKGILEDERQKR